MLLGSRGELPDSGLAKRRGAMDKFQAFEAWAKCFRQVGIALQPLASIGLPAGLQFLVVLLHDFQQSRVLGERIVRFRSRISAES